MLEKLIGTVGGPPASEEAGMVPVVFNASTRMVVLFEVCEMNVLRAL